MTKTTIPEHPSYAVTPDGRIWSEHSNKFLSPYTQNKGYLKVDLATPGGKKGKFVHRLIAETLIGPPVGDMITVDHRDGDKLNNAASNLQWVSVADNIAKEQAKKYQFRNPDGHTIDIYNLNEFSRDFGLDPSNMRAVLAGRAQSHKGWSRV